MNRILYSIFTLTLLLAVSACNKSTDEPFIGPDITSYTIVTYEGTAADGTTTFTFQTSGDSPLITLTAVWNPSPAIDPGTRLLLAYRAENPVASGPVTVMSASRVAGGEPVDGEDISRCSGITVQPVQIWRTGSYLNMRLAASLNSRPVTVKLLLNAESAETPNPQLYIELTQPVDDLNYSNKEVICSWNIGQLWQNDLVEALTIHWKSSLATDGSERIEKSSSPVTPSQVVP